MRVLVVDDHAAFRRAVGDLLREGIPGTVIVEATSGEEATRLAADQASDVALLDLSLGGRSGLETRVADAWHPFGDWVGGWLDVRRGEGFDAVRSAYLDVLEGRVEPSCAHVLTL